MTTPALNRRAFLGAGALLTAGAMLPRTAGAAGLPDDTLAAILNRPLAANALGYRVCSCVHCAAVRSAPFVCQGCGYAGEPVVSPCTCEHERQQSVELFEDLLAGREVMRVDGRPLSRRQIKRHLHAARRAAATGADCTPPNVRCAHTAPACPVCGSTGAGQDDGPFRLNDGPEHAGEIVRDVRAHLTARGLLSGAAAGAIAVVARPAVPIHERMTPGSDSSIMERRLTTRFATPLVGGACELELSESHDPEFYPGQAFLSIFHDEAPGDRALATVLTPAELDQFVIHLTALRDRARAIGLV